MLPCGISSTGCSCGRAVFSPDPPSGVMPQQFWVQNKSTIDPQQQYMSALYSSTEYPKQQYGCAAHAAAGQREPTGAALCTKELGMQAVHHQDLAVQTQWLPVSSPCCALPLYCSSYLAFTHTLCTPAVSPQACSCGILADSTHMLHLTAL
jgi:hypothetical protein